VDFHYVRAGEVIPPADLIILPGSKNTIADLRWLRELGWEAQIQRHLRFGGKLLGICGGFQMLGKALLDPKSIEGNEPSAQGLGWLDMTTELRPHKQLHRRRGRLLLAAETVECEGYEIHAGMSNGAALEMPMIRFDRADSSTESRGATDGALSPCGQIAGTYLHGVFDHPEALRTILAWSGLQQAEVLDYRALREQHLDRLADAAAQHLDMAAIRQILTESI
jgi:adenosylcobyric acid synthase